MIKNANITYLISYKQLLIEMVAPSRFELLSPAPKAGMIDHYTTGLSNLHYTSHIHIFFLRLQTTQRAKYIRIKNIDERDEKDE